MTNTFVLIGSADSIPDHEIECLLTSGRSNERVVIVDEGDRIASSHGRIGIDKVIDLRRGNWDFFADHKTSFGFTNAVDMLLPRESDKPWKGEGRRMVLTELLAREARLRRPTLRHLGKMLGDLKAAEACRLAEIDTDDLNKDELDEIANSLTSSYYYDFHAAEWDRRMKLVSIADWLAVGSGTILFVNGYTRGYRPDAVGNALLAAIRDHTALAGGEIDAVAYTDVAEPLKVAA